MSVPSLTRERGRPASKATLPAWACLLIASSSTACRVPASIPPHLDEVQLARSARTVEQRERFVVHSPYDEEATRALADRIQVQVERVQRLFADTDPAPLTLYLRAVPESERDDHTDLLWRFRPGLGGLSGATVARRYAVLFVPVPDAGGEVPLAFVATWQNQSLIHELAHLCLYRMGIHGPAWLHEGIAEEVESMTLLGAGPLAPDPLPSEFLAARRAEEPFTLAALVGWSADDLNDPAQAHVRRWRCHALARFLMLRSEAEEWADAVRRIAALPASEVLAAEPAFREWLRDLDPLARVRSLAGSAEPAQRTLGAALMPIYAERDPVAMGTREADLLALILLDRPECKAKASTFLIFFAAHRLSTDALERLESSSDPVTRLTALAVRVRRGEQVDLERARELEASLSPEQRLQATVAAMVLSLGPS